jgi:hypothetical protein
MQQAKRHSMAEMIMSNSSSALRSLVDKWFGPTRSVPVRVTRFSRTRASGVRYVSICAPLATTPFEIHFFRHLDGKWCVFPPPEERPAIGIVSRAHPSFQLVGAN